MRRLWFAALAAVFWFACAPGAEAQTCTLPYSFANGTIADADQVNANFTALQTCFTSTAGTPHTPGLQAMRELTGSGSIIRDGYTTPGDGGAGYYVFNASSTCVDDGGSCIRPNTGTGRWVLQPPAGGVSVVVWGVFANGSSDNTSRIQLAEDSGIAHIVFPAAAAAYMMNATLITKPVHIEIAAGATVEQQAANGTTDIKLFEFAAGSEGSILDGGGTIDGNRTVLSPSWQSYAHWNGFSVETTNVTVKNLKIQNFAVEAFQANNCDGSVFRDLSLVSDGTAFVLQYCTNIVMDNVVGMDIGNAGLAIYQHPAVIYGIAKSQIHNVSILSFDPDATGLEPFPIGITLSDVGPGNDISQLTTMGFTGTDQGGGNQSQGIAITGSVGNHYRGLTSIDNLYGVEFNGPLNDTIEQVFADGGYKINGSHLNRPFQLHFGAYEHTNVTNSAFDTVGLTTPRNITLHGVIAMRGDVGAYINAETTTADGIVAIGNNQYGIEIECETANLAIPTPVAQCSRGLVINNSTAQYNGQGGLVASGYWNVVLGAGNDFSDNGQDVTVGATQRGGILVFAGYNSGNMTISPGVRVGDDQDWTSVGGVSFQPGTTNGLNQYPITMANPQRVGIGQYILLKHANGASDVTAKVVALNENLGESTTSGITSSGGMVDQVIIQTNGPTTFSSTGNLTSQTGTISSSGQTVTGSGTAFDTAIAGHTWITNGTQWRRVERINSATELITNLPFSPALSGATYSTLTIEVDGIPSQEYGLMAASGVAGPLHYGCMDVSGLIQAPTYFGNAGTSVAPNCDKYWGGSATAVAGTGSTAYLGNATTSTTEAETQWMMSGVGSVSRFVVAGGAAPGAGETFTLTLRKNAADTTLTCTISGDTDTSCQPAPGSAPVAFVNGDLIDIKIVGSSGAAATSFYGYVLRD